MSSAPTGLRIAVVGAGSSGLLLSLILQRQGHRVTLFERSPRLRTEGCGILLVRSGVEAVAAAAIPGLLDALLAGGHPVQRFVFRNLRGDLIEASPAEREAGDLPSLLIHRSAIPDASGASSTKPASRAVAPSSAGARATRASKRTSPKGRHGRAIC